MNYPLSHYRTMIDRIVGLYEHEPDFMSEKSPVTSEARDGAILFLAQRPDLSIGTWIEPTRSGGLRLDFLRMGREFVLEIDDRGRPLLLSGADETGEEPVSVSTRSVNKAFLSGLHATIPDPHQSPAPDRELVPLAGMLQEEKAGLPGCRQVRSEAGNFLGVVNQDARHGFDVTCFTMPRGARPVMDTIGETIEAIVRSGRGVRLARRMGATRLVSLHDIASCPGDILRNVSMVCGCPLDDLRASVRSARERG